MLKVHVWDEIGGEWSVAELDLPPGTRDPKIISKAVSADNDEDLELDGWDEEDEEDGWEVKSHSFAGPILTIETRSDRNHLGILLVNYENQEV